MTSPDLPGVISQTPERKARGRRTAPQTGHPSPGAGRAAFPREDPAQNQVWCPPRPGCGGGRQPIPSWGASPHRSPTQTNSTGRPGGTRGVGTWPACLPCRDAPPTNHTRPGLEPRMAGAAPLSLQSGPVLRIPVPSAPAPGREKDEHPKRSPQSTQSMDCQKLSPMWQTVCLGEMPAIQKTDNPSQPGGAPAERPPPEGGQPLCREEGLDPMRPRDVRWSPAGEQRAREEERGTEGATATAKRREPTPTRGHAHRGPRPPEAAHRPSRRPQDPRLVRPPTAGRALSRSDLPGGGSRGEGGPERAGGPGPGLSSAKARAALPCGTPCGSVG